MQTALFSDASLAAPEPKSLGCSVFGACESSPHGAAQIPQPRPCHGAGGKSPQCEACGPAPPASRGLGARPQVADVLVEGKEAPPRGKLMANTDEEGRDPHTPNDGGEDTQEF